MFRSHNGGLRERRFWPLVRLFWLLERRDLPRLQSETLSGEPWHFATAGGIPRLSRRADDWRECDALRERVPARPKPFSTQKSKLSTRTNFLVHY